MSDASADRGVDQTGNLAVHASHCCPIHGCKYSSERCPIVMGDVQPYYSYNNGCEDCDEDYRDEWELAWGWRP